MTEALNPKAAPYYMLMAGFWLSFMNISYKYSWQFGSTLFLTLVWRNIGHFSFNYVIMEVRNPKLKFEDLKHKEVDLGLTRGILSTLTSLFSTLGLYYLDYTENQIIAQTKPFMTMFFNWLYFKEPIKPVQIASALLAFVGLLLIIQPPFLVAGGTYLLTGAKLKGFLFRFIGNVWNSLADLTIKEIGGKMHVHFIIFYMGMVNVIVFGIAYCWLDIPVSPSISLQLILLVVGFFSFLTHYFYSLAYQSGSPYTVATVEFSVIIFSYIADYFLLGKSYNLYSYIGTFILILSLSMITYFK